MGRLVPRSSPIAMQPAKPEHMRARPRPTTPYGVFEVGAKIGLAAGEVSRAITVFVGLQRDPAAAQWHEFTQEERRRISFPRESLGPGILNVTGAS